MRPLPRVLACTDDRVAALDDLGVRAAAIAAAGPSVALVARLPHGTADRLAGLAARFVALAAPPMASVLVTGRADVAWATRAHGEVLRKDDLPVSDLCGETEGAGLGLPEDFWLIRSVHSLAEAVDAAEEGADAVIVGTIWESATHPDRAAAGTRLLRQVVGTGLPVFAIGGVTPDRTREAWLAGAWGVATISSVWHAPRPYDATRALLAALECP